MDKQKKNMLEGWYQKASNQLQTAQSHLEAHVRNAEAIQSAQECIEFSVKCILEILNIKYSKTHGWDEKKDSFANIVSQIRDRKIMEKLASEYLGHIRLPRLILLVNFWSHFYLTAKYGYSDNYFAPAKDLFEHKEAEMSVEHANECLIALRSLIYLSEDRLAKIL